MRIICVISLIVLACACTSHGVRCDGRLQPINLAPQEGAPASSRDSSVSEKSKDRKP